MFKNIRNLIVGLVTAASLVAVPIAVPAIASAQVDIQNNLCAGASLDVDAGAGCTTANEGTAQINKIITTVINIFSIIVGVVAVIMIIFGGFRYITSGGDSNNVSAAKNTIIYALIGLVVVALAQFIVKFVLDQVTS
jgi:hypothetical protein